MKKNRWMILGILCGLVFEACVLFLSVRWFDPFRISVQPGVLIGLLLISAFCVNHSCQRYDQADGFVSKTSFFTRWLRNALFLGLLVMFVTALRMTVLENYNAFVLNVNGSQTIVMILVILIAFASVMYLRSYAQNRGRKARIRALKNEASEYGRRYTLLVTDTGKSPDGKHTEVEGFVHGSIQKGDSVTLSYPGKETEKHKILNIHIGDNSSLRATDNDVKLILDCPYEEKKQIEKYTVLSDLNLIHDRKDLNQTENPLLEGIIADYAKYARDPSFQGVLVYALMYSEFLVPGKLVHGRKRGDIMDPLDETSDVGFPTLSSRQNQDLRILPVFTDWDALSRWQDMMREPDAVTVTADFPMTVELMRKGFNGFVINPFGPQAFFLSDTFANSVMRMPGYREEMLERKEKNHD